MTERGSRGRFTWYDLMTTDPDAAASFYPKVVGWGTQRAEGSAVPYTMWTTQDTPIGGVRLTPELGPLPPHWLGYVDVPDVDASAKIVEALGGKVQTVPRDIPDVGRYAVIADPQGAVVAIFTPSTRPAYERPPNVGEFSWHELTTTDHVRAVEFYQELFGWQTTGEFDMGEMGIYLMFGRGAETLGGMWTKPKGSAMPTSWLYYVRVPNVDQAAERVKKLGGQVTNGPIDVPGGGRVAQCVDPQGAAFAVHAQTG